MLPNKRFESGRGIFNGNTSTLPKLIVGGCNLTDKKCTNAVLTTALKSIFFNDYRRMTPAAVEPDIAEKAFSKYIKWSKSLTLKSVIKSIRWLIFYIEDLNLICRVVPFVLLQLNP